MEQKIDGPEGEVNIAVVGKYVDLVESYKSLNEALKHGGFANACKVNLHYIDAEGIEKNKSEEMKDLAEADGLLVPGGFGQRGVEGKIKAIQIARESKVPFFGICLGMQCAVIEYSRNVLGHKDANSTEFDPDTKNPVIDLMEAQRDAVDKGATMRLGAYDCDLTPESKVRIAYGKAEISERHRHRYEFNNKFRDELIKAGLDATGVNTTLDLVETVEIASHPWFVGVQFHPEYCSRPLKPHPLFVDFIEAALQYERRKDS